MVGLDVASVPLYRLFCQATGYGGTTQRAESAPDREVSRQSDHGALQLPRWRPISAGSSAR